MPCIYNHCLISTLLTNTDIPFYLWLVISDAFSIYFWIKFCKEIDKRDNDEKDFNFSVVLRMHCCHLNEEWDMVAARNEMGWNPYWKWTLTMGGKYFVCCSYFFSINQHQKVFKPMQYRKAASVVFDKIRSINVSLKRVFYYYKKLNMNWVVLKHIKNVFGSSVTRHASYIQTTNKAPRSAKIITPQQCIFWWW